MSDWTNIVIATFGDQHRTRTAPLHQWDYGQLLQLPDLELPPTFQVRFSNQEQVGAAKTQIGSGGIVAIPDTYLTTGQYVYAFVFLHAGAADGETVFTVEIPVIPGPAPTDQPPTPPQESAIDQAIIALNEGVAQAEAAGQAAEADALKSEGYAVGTQDDEPVPGSSPYFENNAKYYASLAAASAERASEQAAKVKADTTGLTACTALEDFIDGKALNLSGATVDISAPISDPAYRYIAKPCTAGDAFTVTGTNSSANLRLWAFADQTGTIIDRAPIWTSGSYLLNAPEDAAVLIINQRIAESGFCCAGHNLPQREDVAARILADTTEDTQNRFYLRDFGAGAMSNTVVDFSAESMTISSTGENARSYAQIRIDNLTPGTSYCFSARIAALSGTPYLRIGLRGTTSSASAVYDATEITPVVGETYSWVCVAREGCNGIAIYVSGAEASQESITLTDLMLIEAFTPVPYVPQKTARDGVLREYFGKSDNLLEGVALTPIANCKIETQPDGKFRLTAINNNAWASCYFPLPDLEIGETYYLHAKIDWRKSTTGLFRFRLIGTTASTSETYGGFMLDAPHAVVGEYDGFAIPQDGCRGAVIYIANTASTNAGFILSELMVRKGNKAVPYEPGETVKDYGGRALAVAAGKSASDAAANDVIRAMCGTYAIRHPRVTIIDDDGRVEFYTHLLPMIQRYGVPIATAYSADTNGWRGDGSVYMTVGQLKEIVAAGGEVLAHGGLKLTTVSIEEAEANVLLCKNNLVGHGFTDSLYYVYPSGGNNEAVREMISKHFKAGVITAHAYPGDAYRTNFGCLGNFYINRWHCGGSYYDAIVTTGPYANLDTSTMEYFEALIQEAIANNSWLILYTHSFQMESGQQPTDGVTQFQRLEQIIQRVLELKAGGTDIDICTFKDGFEMFGNAMQFGDFLGPWNETIEHSKPGAAINKLGEYVFPAGNAL